MTAPVAVVICLEPGLGVPTRCLPQIMASFVLLLLVKSG